MKILVTGATGFLGSHLVRRLVADGHLVKILARSASSLGALESLPVNVAWGDVCHPAAVREIVRGCDAVIHTAASLDSWGNASAALQRINVEGSMNVAQSCREEGIGRLVHVSSVAAIGIPTMPDCPATEEFHFNVDGARLPYHWSKHRAEEVVLEEVAQGLDAVIVNPASIFGPHGDTYRGAGLFRKVRRRPIIPTIDGGLCIVHVEDVVDGILAAFRQGVTGQRYILGGDNLSLREVAKRTAVAMRLRRIFVPTPSLVMFLGATVMEGWGRACGRRPYFGYADCRRHYHYYSSEKAHRTFGYAARPFNMILDECLRMKMC